MGEKLTSEELVRARRQLLEMTQAPAKEYYLQCLLCGGHFTDMEYHSLRHACYKRAIERLSNDDTE